MPLTTSSAQKFSNEELEKIFHSNFGVKTKRKKFTFTISEASSRWVSQFVFQHWIALSLKKATRVNFHLMCELYLIHSIYQLSTTQITGHFHVVCEMNALSLIKSIHMDILGWIKSNVINSIWIECRERETKIVSPEC